MIETGMDLYCKFCRKKHSANFHATYTTSLIKVSWHEPSFMGIKNFILFSDLRRDGAQSLATDLAHAMWSFKSSSPGFSSDKVFVLYRDNNKHYNQVIIDLKGNFIFKRPLGQIYELYEAMEYVLYLQSQPSSYVSCVGASNLVAV